MSYIWRYAAAVLLLALTACGFHLKGYSPDSMRPLPFSTLYLSGGGNIAGDLRTQLKIDPRIRLVDRPQDADAVLTVSPGQTRKDILTINSAGQINQYLLIMRFDARLTVHGKDYTPEMQVRVRRTLNYTNSEILGKDQEEQLLWNDMRQDAADQIVRRLSYLKPATESSEPAAEAAMPEKRKAK